MLRHHSEAFQSRQNPQGPVEQPSAVDRIGVGADDHGRLVFSIEKAPDHVARSVQPGPTTQTLYSLDKPAPCGHISLGEGHAIDAGEVVASSKVREFEHFGAEPVQVDSQNYCHPKSTAATIKAQLRA